MIRRPDARGPLEEAGDSEERRRELLLVTLQSALIVAVFVTLGIVLYAAQFSGALRWALAFLLVAAVAVWAVLVVVRGTEEPAPLATRSPRAAILGGELGWFASAVRRADGGLAYSQVLVSTRARDAFGEHVRLARGLTPEGLRRLEADGPALWRLFGDDVLTDFLYLGSADFDERYRWVEAARDRGRFRPSLVAVLDRMEAWR